MSQSGMNNKTKEELLDAIKHWNEIIAHIEATPIWAEHCNLCKKYNKMMLECSWDTEYCKGCPIAKATDAHGCANTPHGGVRQAYQELWDQADKMREFLYTLYNDVVSEETK